VSAGTRSGIASWACGLVLAGIVAASSPAASAGPTVRATGAGQAAGSEVGPEDPQELARFADAFMTTHLTELHAPGAVVEVVSASKILLEKGYGLADLERRSPFGPDTRFRAKSVSKAFTATAVMQLSEEGRVDLTASVVSYLPGFTLPGGNDPPITLGQLLTQTSGLGDRGIGTMTPDPDDASRLRQYLQAHLPPRLAAPGTVFLYTDHGISLAGLAVEEVSGLPFAR